LSAVCAGSMLFKDNLLIVRLVNWHAQKFALGLVSLIAIF
jgi:hypothetical protein